MTSTTPPTRSPRPPATCARCCASAGGNLSQAVFGYNHSQAYVNDVLARARTYAGLIEGELVGPVGDATVMTGCAGGGLDAPVGPANLRVAQRVFTPRAFRTLPSWALAAGTGPAAVDARLYDDVVWILRRYHLRVTAAREAGHRTHGDGTAVDLVPADGITQAVWDASAGRLARDLGWTPACAPLRHAPPCAASRRRSNSSATTATPAMARRATARAASPRHVSTSLRSPSERWGTLAPRGKRRDFGGADHYVSSGASV